VQVLVVLVGIAVVAIGFLMLRQSGEASDTLRDVNPVAKRLYTPAATGCAGLVLIVCGIAFAIAGMVWGVGSMTTL
jgi:hypothetical protein